MDLYCKMFINTRHTIDELAKIVAEYYGLEWSNFHSIEGSIFSIYVNKNDEFDEGKSKEFPDGFLYFPYYLDIEPLDNEKAENYIDIMGKLLDFLWSNGVNVVTSCDFEHLLPQQGGYKKEWHCT